MRAWFLLCFLLAPLGAGLPLADQAVVAALAFAEGQAAGRAGKYTFKVVQLPIVPALRPGAAAVEASHLSKLEPQGRFFVALRVNVDGRPAGTMRVDLEGQWMGEVLKARTSLARRQALTEDLVERVPMEGQPPAGALSDIPQGMRLRIPVTVGRILTRADLEPIPLINPGDKVRVVAVAGDLTVQAEGTARSGGVIGDAIRLEMPSRRMISAHITAPGEARILFAK
jgi:flagella basal body P-ring formation protein FlgA